MEVILTWLAKIQARLVASTSTSSSRDSTWPSGPVIPSSRRRFWFCELPADRTWTHCHPSRSFMIARKLDKQYLSQVTLRMIIRFDFRFHSKIVKRVTCWISNYQNDQLIVFVLSEHRIRFSVRRLPFLCVSIVWNNCTEATEGEGVNAVFSCLSRSDSPEYWERRWKLTARRIGVSTGTFTHLTLGATLIITLCNVATDDGISGNTEADEVVRSAEE